MACERVRVRTIKVARVLYDFVNREVVPGTNICPSAFWSGVEAILNELSPQNRLLLNKRDVLQSKIDQWHRSHQAEKHDPKAYKQFLQEIGYILPRNPDDQFKISTTNVDDEISKVAGPQLVVPLMNARFTLNAANARWGSLYDALYGTDVIPEDKGFEKTKSYNRKRGDKVIAYTRNFLDENIPLKGNLSHSDAINYSIQNGQLIVGMKNRSSAVLKFPEQFRGYQGIPEKPSSILFQHNGLHIEIKINPPKSRDDPAGIEDVIIESAVTTIVDCEDSVAAVDANDKVEIYRNWLGLMKGTLNATFPKGKGTITRVLNFDRLYQGGNQNAFQLPGRSLLLIRHVGLLLYTDSILLEDDQEVPEGIVDALVTTLIALHDVRAPITQKIRNSRSGSIYVVKPKQHGPEEVAFTSKLFARVEDLLNLPRNTLKMGVMDEERRTTLNLSACIRECSDRLVFINTGFLDRTGDDIHTSMEAGPLVPKAKMKEAKWLTAYEKNNVEVGLKHGLSGVAQIGKGMWAMPDMMASMLVQKIGHLRAGANCAWVPSPTAATLHALHYHQIDVFALQNQMMQKLDNQDNYFDDILSIPILQNKLSNTEIKRELMNNAQSILGYVVRWIDQGVGCSKVPDIDNIGLMEDRATLRISSQLIANWLHHKLISQQQVIQAFQKMALVVDEQNANIPDYRPMASDFDHNIAFQAALELVIEGTKQPNGYTELILHKRRRQFKIRNPKDSTTIRSSL